MGLNVMTADIDPSLDPDFICSVTDLSKTFKPNSFDCILCAEVLEHIPFEYFEIALEIPVFFLKHKFGGEHYWEIGKRYYSLGGGVKRVINKKFKIVKEFSPAESPFDRFFILLKRGGG